MDEQQEVHRIIMNAPRTVRDAIHMLQALQRHMESKKNPAPQRAVAGENELSVMTADNRMLAEPQLFNAKINLDELSQYMKSYEIPFAIKTQENGVNEVHFFINHRELATKAIEKAGLDLIKDPSKVSGKNFEDFAKEAKSKQSEILAHMAAEKTDKAADKVAEKVVKGAEVSL